jgi:uncharacterized protein (TIGR03067 family)
MTLKLEITFALVALAGAFLVGGMSAVSVASADDKKVTDKAASHPLEGGYTIVSGEEDGKPTPPEHIKGSIVMFTADKIVGTDHDKKEIFTASYTLDTTKDPWTIKMKTTLPKEMESVGLVKKDKDTIKLIYSLPGAPAPTEFKTKEHQHLFVLKMLDVKAKP